MKKALVVLVVVVAGFAAFVATRPAHFKVSRELTMKAPAEAILANVVDFHEWAEWSPWDKLDPLMVKTFTGPDRGVGATYHWSGNDKVGEGEMKILDAQPSRVVIALDFLKPMNGHSTTTFAFLPHMPGQTMVTWTMEGENNFVGKAFCLFVNMDKKIGGDFERGLEALRIASENDVRKAAEARLEEQKKMVEQAAVAANGAVDAAPAPPPHAPLAPTTPTRPPVPALQAR